jgi:aminoglycoside/choline kinase family phosphotransferase
LNGYRGLGIEFHDLKEEFELLAEMALENGYTGFIHRDFQSRNIIVRGNRHYVIDFQGGRLGPLAYDIASLLIDPYAGLSQQLQADLLSYHVTRLQEFLPIDPADFLHGYKYCAINRNLQILGAFAFLSQVKGKGEFRSYIPEALKSLKHNVQQVEPTACKALKHILERL